MLGLASIVFVKTGVEMRLAGDASELFADARALESAGADSLWVIARDDADAWTLAAGIAAVTWRARIVVAGATDRPGARATVERLSRGRLVVSDSAGPVVTLNDAEGQPERWTIVEFPDGREQWKALRAEREAAGFAGIVVSNDRRLLDLLRNPDLIEDRQDIKLAFG